MGNNIFINMVFNVGFLVLIANLMSRTTLFKNIILGRKSRMSNKLLLAAFFGGISVLATYTGTGVNGAIVNTRVIGVLAAGLMGGPVVGMGAALIGGLHRWLFDIGGFTSVACACSTILVEGVLGSLFHRRFQSGRMKWWDLMLLTAVAEIGQMAVILLLARPFLAAVELVRIIAVPMILMNSCGIVAFIGAFQHIFVEQNSLADRRIRQAMHIAEQCLPHLRKGLSSSKDLDCAAEIIYTGSNCAGVVFTDDSQIISCIGELHFETIPQIVREVMKDCKSRVADRPEDCLELADLLNGHVLVASPLTDYNREKAVGCLVLLESRRWLPLNEEQVFVEGLATLFSTQLELSQVEYQKSLLKRAEFQRLQSQVNPHFLFNCLNTISFFCREKPERARELLLLLGQYYRYSTNHSDEFIPIRRELEQVDTYLQLEKARFEEKLNLEQNIQADMDMDFPVPSLILQPIVENAVKHGMDVHGIRHISINVRQEQGRINIQVADRGQGFPDDILEGLGDGSVPGDKVGLCNVHQRLKSIYGPENGLLIASSREGSSVTICLPLSRGKEIRA